MSCIYEFEFDKIHSCFNCPLFYREVGMCMLEEDIRDGCTDRPTDNNRPAWCKLKEVKRWQSCVREDGKS